MTKLKSKSEIFRKAWQIAREAALRWGGSARSYLGAALRSIYADLRKAAMRAACCRIARSMEARQAAARSAAAAEEVSRYVWSFQAAKAAKAADPVVEQASAAGVTAPATSTGFVTKVSNIVSKTLGFFRKVFDFSPREVALE